MSLRFDVACLVVPLLLGPISHAQELSSQPKEAAKLCVAVVANRSRNSLMLEQLTDRLTRSLMQNKIYTVKIESETTREGELRPTVQNSTDMKTLQCDFLLLTQASDQPSTPMATDAPSISIGKRAPSTDASDPMGGSSGPVYRENVEIRFAIFRPGKIKADMETAFLAQPSGHASDSLISAMDREANRVAHELKDK